MITGYERREVAKLLRERAGYEMGCVFKELYGDCNSAGPTCGECNERAMRYLADLIEPSIPADPGEAGLAFVDGFIREMRHSTKEEQNEYSTMLKKMSVELHPVDRDALLALADEISSTSCDKVDGELTVDLITVWGWAQEIRDALGVSDA